MKMTALPRVLTAIVVLLLGGVLNLRAADKYFYNTRYDDSTRLYIVDITNNTATVLICEISYTGQSLIGQDINRKRRVFVRSVGKGGKTVVVPVHFGGIKNFSASAVCAAK